MSVTKKTALFLIIFSTSFYGADNKDHFPLTINDKHPLLLLAPHQEIQNKIATYHKPDLGISFDNQLLRKDLQFFYLWRPVSLTSKVFLKYFGHETQSLMKRFKTDQEFWLAIHQIPTIDLSTLSPDSDDDNSYYSNNVPLIQTLMFAGDYILQLNPAGWIESLLEEDFQQTDFELTYSKDEDGIIKVASFFDLLLMPTVSAPTKDNVIEYQKALLAHYQKYPDAFVYRGQTNISFGDTLFNWYLHKKESPNSKRFFENKDLWMPLFCEFIFSKDLHSLAINQELIEKNPEKFKEFKNLFIEYNDLFCNLGTIDPRIPPLKAIQLKVICYLIQQGIPKTQ